MMTCGRYFFRDMKNAVPTFRFRFSLVDDALKLLVESCRNTADFVTLVLIVPYAADVSMENSLTLATPSMCRRTVWYAGRDSNPQDPVPETEMSSFASPAHMAE